MPASLKRSAFFVFVISLFLLPLITEAVGMSGDAMCNPVLVQCPCGQVPDQQGQCQMKSPMMNKHNCPNICFDNTNGFMTYGNCPLPGKCHGDTAAGKGLDQGLSKLGEMLGQLLSKLMQQQQQQQQPQQQQQTQTGCTTGFFQTSDPTIASGNPCAQYVPAINVLGGTSTGLTDLSGILGGAPPVDLSGVLNGNTNTGTSSNTVSVSSSGVPATGTSTATTTPSAQIIYYGSSTISGLNPNLPSGINGNIVIGPNGVTVLGGSRDLQSNTAVSGFIGSQTSGQPLSLAAQLCINRPWATNFLSWFIPASFFDNLCTQRGYQVGVPPPSNPQPQVTLTQTPVQPKTATTTPATTTISVQPKVDIWASPISVPLGTRTNVFWRTQGVTKCTVTSSDGNFNQNSLSGGAATVPITEATTFTISCLASDGSTVTHSVTVNLSI
jgi:hypothetical protein